MATEKTTVSTEDGKKEIMRQLNGTSFLTLEHVGYFVLVVLLPVLLLAGAATALQLWQNGNASTTTINDLYMYPSVTVSPIFSSTALSLTAALLVLAPFMYVLRRRTAAEYGKRPGYAARVAYKLPVYTALGVLAALSTGAVVTMLGVFLDSLANIGVSGVNIGTMYMQQFLPALLAFAVFALSCWYVAWLAKGRDMSKTFVGVIGALSAVMVITLFVTVVSLNHDTKTYSPGRVQPMMQDGGNTYLRY
jgi:hypothetical protein